MVTSRLKLRAALLLTVGILAADARWAVCQALDKNADEDKQLKEDYYGDPLPPGVVARMGSVQFRHDQADFVFSADGKSLISAGDDQRVITWEVATGKLTKTVKIQRSSAKSAWFERPTLAPGGKILVAWEDKQVFVYDTSSGKEMSGRASRARSRMTS